MSVLGATHLQPFTKAETIIFISMQHPALSQPSGYISHRWAHEKINLPQRLFAETLVHPIDNRFCDSLPPGYSASCKIVL